MSLENGCFYNTPIFNVGSSACSRLVTIVDGIPRNNEVFLSGLEHDKVVLIKDVALARCENLFRELVVRYGLQDSYDIQMQYVVHTIKDRDSYGDSSVTVNERGPYQLIQPHAEGDTSSPLDLFGLYCVRSPICGGENILSLINQSADCSRLRAKEKIILGQNLTPSEILAIRGEHFDAKVVVDSMSGPYKVLVESDIGSVVVAQKRIQRSMSNISRKKVWTYWDNVTVHDRAFHRYNYELLKSMGILLQGLGADYLDYAYIESDSSWAPIDTDSGGLEQTAKLFDCHVVYNLRPGDFLLFNNRAWVHSVNNWDPSEIRKIVAMYA